MKLPRLVYIAPLVYEVQQVEDLRDGETTLDGWVKPSTQVIEVDARLVGTPARVTLLHEIVHAVLVQSGHLVSARDEGLAHALSYGLLNVTVDGRPLVQLVDAGEVE